jgi:hypothetical protein
VNASLLMTRRPSLGATWREEPHTEHVSERGRVAPSASPTWPHGQATLTSTFAPKNSPGRQRGLKLCTRYEAGLRSCSYQDQAYTARAHGAMGRGAEMAHEQGRKKPPVMAGGEVCVDGGGNQETPPRDDPSTPAAPV